MNIVRKILQVLSRWRRAKNTAQPSPVNPQPVPPANSHGYPPSSRDRCVYDFSAQPGDAIIGTETIYQSTGKTLESATIHSRVLTAHGTFVSPSKIRAQCAFCPGVIEDGAEENCDHCGKCACHSHLHTLASPAGEIQLCPVCLAQYCDNINTWDHTPPAVPFSVARRFRMRGKANEE